MRKPIEGKHLKMELLPAAEGTCGDCAIKHDPGQPHNAQSMFYQYRFYNEHGRWPNWKDAMAHCDKETKEIWTLRLEESGVNVEAGEVNPRRNK